MKDDRADLTLKLTSAHRNALHAFLASDNAWFASADELVSALLEALTCCPGSADGHRSFMDFLAFVAEQRGIPFEDNLFGRMGNEHDRRQLYGLMLGMNRLQMVNDYEWAEWKEKGPHRFARDVATRFAKDLERADAERLIETMTLGSPSLQAEMLHWLDIGLAAKKT